MPSAAPHRWARSRWASRVGDAAATSAAQRHTEAPAGSQVCSWRSAVCDLVVAAAGELQKAKSVAERIREIRDVSPSVRFGGAFAASAGGDGPAIGRLEIGDDEVEMNRGPVTAVIARHFRAGKRRRAGRLDEQIDRRLGAEELHAMRAEASPHTELESGCVKGDRRIEIVDVDVDENLRHQNTSSPKPAALAAAAK